jgi:DTW domain-containing protein YfiP
MHAPLCICDLMPALSTRTRVVALMHSKERGRVSNTARLTGLFLTEGHVRVRGQKDQPLDPHGIRSPRHLDVVLFPSADAVELDAAWVARQDRPLNLIAPDGSWGQVRRMVRREPTLAALLHLRLPAGPPSRFRLRSQPRADGLATFEAIARALGIIEGDHVRAPLDYAFDVMVERTLWTRGALDAARVTGGIPAAAFRPELVPR